MLFLGSGAQGAATDIRALCEMLGSPATALRGGRGIVPESSELGLSSYAASTLWPEVDVAHRHRHAHGTAVHAVGRT